MNTGSKQTEKEPGEDIQLELKYCERCGGLWLRERGCGEVYCVHCQPEVAELPARKPPRSTRISKPRLPSRSPGELDWDVDDFDAGWELPPTAGER